MFGDDSIFQNTLENLPVLAARASYKSNPITDLITADLHINNCCDQVLLTRRGKILLKLIDEIQKGKKSINDFLLKI